MIIGKGTSAAVVVSRDWANLWGVRRILRYYEHPEREIRGTDQSHLVLARVLDSDDPHGLWIELNTARHEKNPTVDKLPLLIPWSAVLSVVIFPKKVPADIQDEVGKIGFT